MVELRKYYMKIALHQMNAIFNDLLTKNKMNYLKILGLEFLQHRIG